MRSFDELYTIAKERHGDALAEKIGAGPKPISELVKIPEDRWLATFTKVIFQSGFNWRVIENKWDGFEEAFKGFDIDACAFMPEDWFDELTQDRRIVRYPAKIKSVQDNATFIQSLRAQGGVAQVIAEWPSYDYVGLIAMLKKDASRLGGVSGQYALRFMGRDGFILSRDVVARLIAEGVIEKEPTSKKALQQVQEAFSELADESGRTFVEISRVMALSI